MAASASVSSTRSAFSTRDDALLHSLTIATVQNAAVARIATACRVRESHGRFRIASTRSRTACTARIPPP